MPSAATTRWHGKTERQLILGAEAARRARRPWPPGPLGELAVRHDLTPSHAAKRERKVSLKRRAPVEVERNVVVGNLGAVELRDESPAQIRHKGGTVT